MSDNCRQFVCPISAFCPLADSFLVHRFDDNINHNKSDEKPKRLKKTKKTRLHNLVSKSLSIYVLAWMPEISMLGMKLTFGQ